MEIEEGQATANPVADADPSFEAKHRARLPPDERRDKLLDAALAVFSELGFEQATLNDVAERIGVTKGCFYHYFESKEQLLVELVRARTPVTLTLYEDLLEGSAGSRDERVASLIERMWSHLQEPGQIELALLMLTQMPRIPELRRFLVGEVLARKQEMLQQVLRLGKSDEGIAADVAAAAAVIPSMIIGAALCQHLFKGGDRVGLTAEQLGQAVTAILLHGVSRPAAPDPAVAS